MTTRIFVFAALVVALAALLAYSQLRTQPRKVSGFIEADEIRLGSRVGGRVKRVAAQEGQRTTAGDVLVELEPFDLVERRAEAEARLSAAKAEHARLVDGFRPEEIEQAAAHRDQLAARLDLLRAGPRKQEITAAEARGSAARAERMLAQQVYERTRKLFQQGAATQAELDHVQEQRNAAEANLVVRDQELATLREGARAQEILEAEAQLREAQQLLLLRKNGYRAEEIAQAKATVDAGAAALAAIDQQIAELVIKAPVDGVVEAVELQPGDLVVAGAPVLSLMDIQNLWVRAYVPANRLDLGVGDKLALAVDSFPGERFEGEVTFISRQAEFTPGNVQTPEERSKQVFRVKITLREGRDRLRPGMTADVYLTRP